MSATAERSLTGEEKVMLALPTMSLAFAVTIVSTRGSVGASRSW